MNFLKDIFLGAIKGILSLGIALIMLLIFFSIIGALFSPDTEQEVVVSDNSLLYIDNLSLIGDRDTDVLAGKKSSLKSFLVEENIYAQIKKLT